MKRTIFLAATVAAMAAGATRAADVYGGAPYPATPAAYIAQNAWTGPYIGANIGYQFGRTTLFSMEPSGATGGVQGGYNLQFGQIVVGGEVDFQVSGAEDTFAPYKFSNPWFGTARARLGYAMNNILVYATGGLAYGKGQLDYLGFSEDHTHGGWAVGAGLEVGLMRNLSVRAEYLFVDLSATNYTFTNMNTGIESSIVRFGLNYRF
jgi:outer membrane immunogenic protein